MSNKQQHKDKAENNEFLVTTLQNPFWDWGVTVRFYAALQYVDAYLATKTPPVHPPNHTSRDNEIVQDAVLSPLWDDYRELKNESRTARYEPHAVFAQADGIRLQKKLNTIKATIVPLL